MTPNEVLMMTLERALSVKRPYGSYEEGALITWLHAEVVSNRPQADTWIDGAGNLHVDLRYFSGGVTENRTLFVAHVDTVHRTGGVNVYDCSTPMWKADGKAPLGADDGAGVALLAALIHAWKPAYYIFTRGEERGGVGSSYLAKEHEDLLEEFDRAIAFDRKDTWSVITHQGMGRCCSDVFGDALASALNDAGMFYATDDSGVYTDTAEFVDIIPECTNLSAGYYDEHRPEERLDTNHLQALCTAAIAIDWDALPTKRDPNEIDDDFLGRWKSKYTPAPKYTSNVVDMRQVGTAKVLETIGGLSDDELDDVVFGWKDDAGRQGTGTNVAPAKNRTHSYKDHTIVLTTSSHDTINYLIIDPAGHEADYCFGYDNDEDALLEAKVVIDGF